MIDKKGKWGINMWDTILKTVDGLNNKFPQGNEPFKIMTRLLEECGELAAEVNHFEGEGLKIEKHGEPDKEKMAGEIKNLIWCVMQLAVYYGIENQVRETIEQSYKKLVKNGYIK